MWVRVRVWVYVGVVFGLFALRRLAETRVHHYLAHNLAISIAASSPQPT